jgi:hypothetical protein
MGANWPEMVEFFSDLLEMDTESHDWLQQTKVARLMAELPHIAGCADPDRAAYAHVSTLLVASRNPKVFGHRSSDTLRSRLFAVSHFDGGDSRLIERGLHLLELASLSDHIADVDYDRVVGKYNPLNTGEVTYDSERDRLVELIEAVPCPEMDQILSVAEAIKLRWWCCGEPEPVVDPARSDALAV